MGQVQMRSKGHRAERSERASRRGGGTSRWALAGKDAVADNVDSGSRR